MEEEIGDYFQGFWETSQNGWVYLNDHRSAVDLASWLSSFLPSAFSYRGYDISDVSTVWYLALDYVLPVFRLMDMVIYARLWIALLVLAMILKIFALSISQWSFFRNWRRRAL